MITSAHQIGMISLNLSFVLYLIVYIPQILHNRDQVHLQNLSSGMHGLLFIGLFLDLFYGFSNDFQWQYKTVSIVSLSVLGIQHLQLTHLMWQQKQLKKLISFLCVLTLSALILVHFFTHLHHHVSQPLTLMMGYISRTCCLLYALPQILKNTKLSHRSSISPSYILINMVLIFLDTVSSWCLDWGWPNKLSTPIAWVFMMILYRQQTHQRA
jgi:hypothetical protein